MVARLFAAMWVKVIFSSLKTLHCKHKKTEAKAPAFSFLLIRKLEVKYQLTKQSHSIKTHLHRFPWAA